MPLVAIRLGNRSLLVGALLASFSVSGCGGGGSGALPPHQRSVAIGGPHTVTLIGMPAAIPDAQIDANIDAAIQGSERALMSDIMHRLRPESRKNVIYRDAAGNVHVNHLSLRALYHGSAQPIAGSPRRFRRSNGEAFTVPMDDLTAAKPSASHTRRVRYTSPPEISTTTGAYRRWFSNTGYSYIGGSVDTPCTPSNFSAATASTGYLYIGGWSDTGDQVDAGLQYSQFYDDYEVYFKHKGEAPDDLSFYFPCGNSAFMQFYVVDSTTVNLTVNGFDSTGGPATYSYPRAVSGSGWNAYGGGPQGGLVMKRALSIAQNTPNFNTGEYFAYDPTTGNPTIGWSQWQVGTNYVPGGANNLFWLDLPTGYADLYPDWNSDVVTRPYPNASISSDEIEGITLTSP